MVLPPSPVRRSILATSVFFWAFGRALVVAVSAELQKSGASIAPGVGELWTFLFVLSLIWVEIHRRGYRIFLLNLGVPRRSLMVLAACTVVAAEVVVLAIRALSGGGG